MFISCQLTPPPPGCSPRNWAFTMANTLCEWVQLWTSWLQSEPSLPPGDLFLLPHTSVTHATDVNILLWCHQPVLHHNDCLLLWPHHHGFVDKPSTPSLTRPLKRLRRGRNRRSGSQCSFIWLLLVSLLHYSQYLIIITIQGDMAREDLELA